MPTSKAQQRAVNKYVKKNYEDIKFRVPKGKKAAIQTHAETNGESVNAFINRAVDEAMARDQSHTEETSCE
jgi:predicted HicB family RNase H-like nuclease